MNHDTIRRLVVLLKPPARYLPPASAMQRIEPSQKDAVPVGEVRKRNEHQPRAKGSQVTSMSRQIEADRRALSCASGARLAGLPNARRARRSPPR